MAVQAPTLLACVADASGPEHYPARLGMDSAALHGIAAARMGPGGNRHLRRVCAELFVSGASGVVWADSRTFTDDDAAVIGFFLSSSTTCTALQ